MAAHIMTDEQNSIKEAIRAILFKLMTIALLALTLLAFMLMHHRVEINPSLYVPRS